MSVISNKLANKMFRFQWLNIGSGNQKKLVLTKTFIINSQQANNNCFDVNPWSLLLSR